ncbi:MAG: ion channel [Pseudomonadota bacterium]
MGWILRVFAKALVHFWSIVPAAGGSTPGSRNRNRFSFFIFSMTVVLLFELVFQWFNLIGIRPTVWTTGLLTALGFLFFSNTTIGVMRLQSEQFQVAPGRLIRDIAISIAFSIVAFALFYRSAGILATFTESAPPGWREHVYFSIVTFSTLGYGDFRPSPDARLIAGAQALLGTIHIGMIVGAAFFTLAAQNKD